MKKMFVFLLMITSTTIYAEVRLKSIAHLSGIQENPLTGYGLVIGLAGSGDSQRNRDTTQAIVNLLQTFGVNLQAHDISSRNAATVIVTANLPAYAHQGDKIDINVASMGDARSLLGGTLLVTPLKGPDNQTYALAQGSVSIGGFKYDLFGNAIQKNHPTTGLIPGGAVVEKSIYTDLKYKSGIFHYILNQADFTTAYMIEQAINHRFKSKLAQARSAQDIEIHPTSLQREHFVRFISELENIKVTPDRIPTVVINERTGVIVAGADVRLEAITISHGNLHVSISTAYQTSQPMLVDATASQVRTTVTPATSLNVKEQLGGKVSLDKGATIAELIAALNKVHTSTRDVITILETIKRAGALHAELIIQ